MRALFFSNMDYDLHLDPKVNELYELRNGPLKAPLEEAFTGRDLKKEITLRVEKLDLSKMTMEERYREHNGLYFEYLPEGTFGWDKIKGANVKITPEVLDGIETRGMFITRYDGENKITIIYK